MIRIGMVGFDTSHTVGFARCLNRNDAPPEQRIEGARIVAGLFTEPCPGRRDDAKKYVAQVSGMGVEMVESAEELLRRVDAVMLECVDGHAHLKEIQPFLGQGKPIFVDKPFAGTGDQARRIAELAAQSQTPLYSASSMRYAPEIAAFKAADLPAGAGCGEIVQALAYGPSQAQAGSEMTAMIFYGVHAAEVLYTLLGPGCREVSSFWSKNTDAAVGLWPDGRTGCVLGTRESRKQWGFTAFCRKAVEHRSLDISRVDLELQRRVTEFFRTGRSPVPIEETMEIISFLDAAAQSAAQGGRSVAVRT